MKFHIVSNGRERTVTLLSRDKNSVRFEIEGKEYDVTALPVELTTKSGLNSPSSQQSSTPRTNTAPKSHSSSPNKIHAPIAGTVSSVLCEIGESVTTGQAVFVLEAMKMENNIAVSTDGTVQEIHVEVGNQVKSGDLLLTLSLKSS